MSGSEFFAGLDVGGSTIKGILLDESSQQVGEPKSKAAAAKESAPPLVSYVLPSKDFAPNPISTARR